MRLLVCGSRTFNDRDFVWSVLDRLLRDEGNIEIVINGGAQGADSLGFQWALVNHLPALTVPANWEEYGKAAGPIRNEAMLVNYEPDLVVAFTDKPLEQSRGTAHMVRISRAKGVNVVLEGVQ